MARKILAATGAFLLVPALALAAGPPEPLPSGQQRDGPFPLGVVLGVDVGGVVAESDGLDGAEAYGVRGAVMVSSLFGIELSVRALESDFEQTPENLLSRGDVSTTAFTVNGLVYLPIEGRVAPYVTGGLAFFTNDVDVSPAVADPLAELNFIVSEEVEDVFGLNVGGGAEVRARDWLGVYGDLRYFHAEADTHATLATREGGVAARRQGTQDLDNLVLSVGVLFRF